MCYRFDESRQYLEQAVEGMIQCTSPSEIRTLATTEELALTLKDIATSLPASAAPLAHNYLATPHHHATFVTDQRTAQLGGHQPFTWLARGTLARVLAA